MFEKIIVPLDGSEQAELILPYIEKLAIIFGSNIDFCVVMINRDNITLNLLKKYLDNLSNNLTGKRITVKSSFLPGNPGDEIINYANNIDNALLVMTSYGSQSSGQWLIGDLTGKLVTRTNTPVLLVPEKQNVQQVAEPEFRNIVVPLDLSIQGARALPFAKEIARKTGSKLFLLNVLSTVHKSYGAFKYAADFEKQLVETLHKEAQDYFQSITGDLENEKLEFQTDIISGSPADSIIRYAEEQKADLIAVSTHGASGVKRFIMGSVAQKVVQSSDIPLLVIRAKT